MKFLESLETERFHIYKINDLLFCLEECTDHEKGLSGREHLHPKDGMLFQFDEPGKRPFHMKGCKIPLDILFIKNNEIRKIYHNCPPCDGDICEKYTCEDSDLVVELKGGTCKSKNISEGLIYRLF